MSTNEDAALESYWKGDFKEALAGFRIAAADGSANAMMMLANMYEEGEGVEADWDQSYQWARRAIEAGSLTALLNLGISFRRRGDMRAARDCFQEAADRGDGEAALELAQLYLVSELERPRVLQLLRQVLTGGGVSADAKECAQRLLDELQATERRA